MPDDGGYTTGEPAPKQDWGSADTWLGIVTAIIGILKGTGVLHKDETPPPCDDKPTGDPVKDFS